MRLLLAILLLALHTVCEGAAPSLSTVSFPSALGGVTAMAADSQGNLYMAGTTFGTLPATPGAAQTQYGGGECNTVGTPPIGFPCTDAFVAKVNSTNGTVIWATYLGGDMNDGGTGIAVDPAGNVYVTGYTFGNFPVTPGTYISNSGAGMFVTKVSSDGSRFLYSTLVPGEVPTIGVSRLFPGVTPAPAIAVDAQGNAYVTGPNTGNEGGSLVIKLNPQGSAVVYNTPILGLPGTVIALDAGGYAYVTGTTSSPALPVTSSAAQTKLAGAQNAFVEKLDPSGSLVMATYLGGSQYDQGVAVETDADGNIYIGGTTTSFNFPTTQGSYLPQAALPSSADVPGGFVAKLSPEGALLYSTYIIGGESTLGARSVVSIMPDGAGGVYAAGMGGPGLSVTPTAPQPCENGEDSVVTHLGTNGNLIDRTHFGYPNPGYPMGLAMPQEHSVGLLALVGLPGETSWTPVAAHLDFGDGVTPPASCLSTDVLNAANFLASPIGGIVPGTAITLTGYGLGPETGVSAQRTAAGSLPTEASGVQVLINGQAVPLLYVQSQQINAFAPFTLSPYTTATVTVTYNGATAGSTSMTTGSGSQWGALFRLGYTSTQAAAINQDGTLNGPDHPAPVGSVIALYGTGFGQTQLPGVSGMLFPDSASLLATTTPFLVTINGIKATVAYAGAAPLDWAGIDQVNVQIPVGAVAGINGISVQSSAVSSGLTIWVQ